MLTTNDGPVSGAGEEGDCDQAKPGTSNSANPLKDEATLAQVGRNVRALGLDEGRVFRKPLNDMAPLAALAGHLAARNACP